MRNEQTYIKRRVKSEERREKREREVRRGEERRGEERRGESEIHRKTR